MSVSNEKVYRLLIRAFGPRGSEARKEITRTSTATITIFGDRKVVIKPKVRGSFIVVNRKDRSVIVPFVPYDAIDEEYQVHVSRIDAKGELIITDNEDLIERYFGRFSEVYW